MSPIGTEFVELCAQVIAYIDANGLAAMYDSPDQFHTEKFYCGWWDDESSIEGKYIEESGKECWFELTLDQVRDVLSRKLEWVDMHCVRVGGADGISGAT